MDLSTLGYTPLSLVHGGFAVLWAGLVADETRTSIDKKVLRGGGGKRPHMYIGEHEATTTADGFGIFRKHVSLHTAKVSCPGTMYHTDPTYVGSKRTP